MLIPCLIRPTQQAVDTLLAADLADYFKVKAIILQTLNISSEAYCCHLQEIQFGLDYHPRLIGHGICLPAFAGLSWTP